MRTSLAKVSWPPSTDVSPESMRSSVVLPAPLRPARVSRSRRSSLNETPRSSGEPAMSLARSEAMQTAIAAPMVGSAAMRRLASTLLLSAFTLLLFAQVALANEEADHGEGLWGETTDRVVTYAGFILIAAFPLFVFTMSMIQGRLEKRKDLRLKAERA